ncbi:NlpC/P60 family protein [Streptomyces sp. IMTB 2501]|uniref:C40 family peptidase n=1 Tax=Streptomyces sp. IMTB 2501 TaxID=1776340 RepID=UPI0021164B56|nr:NlpC/P60 family protein [Streptomyces sp. IMTB 2501]
MSSMAPESRDEVAQRDEVRQRINSLYDQAENATGNYNATRAMASVSRSREVAPADRSGRRSDPALDEVTRQWFDMARAKLGPTVPAVLPADRLPDRPAAPGRSRRRMGGGLPDGTRDALGPGPSGRRPEALERAVDRVVAELTAGRATDPASLALAARESGRVALPASHRPELPSGGAELGENRLVAVETAVLPLPALSAAPGAPVQEARALPGTTAPSRPSPAVSKANNQRKLAAASDVISRYAAQLVTYAAAVQPAPATAVPPAPDTAVPLAPDTASAPALVTDVALAPVTAIPPTTTRFPSDFGTGQWEQPQWEAPAGTVTADAWSAPMASVTSASVPTTAAPTASVTDTGPLAPVTDSPEAVRVAKAVAFARAQIGKPCVWGATGPDSYDCSSLTQAAWKAAGVTLPRAAHQQALAGAPVTLAGIEPGDLVLFFDDDRHVGLHVGGGMMVHAPGPGSSIREESIYGAGESAIHRIVRPA